MKRILMLLSLALIGSAIWGFLEIGKVAAAAMWAFIAGMMAMIAWDQW